MPGDTCWVTATLSSRVFEQDGAAEFHLSGEFDLDGASKIQQQLTSSLESHARLILDLSGVTFMDSSGVGVLVRTKNAAGDRNVQLVVRLGESAAVRRLLDLVGLQEFLDEPSGNGNRPPKP